MSGPKAEVTVTRDVHGVPHIRAADREDAFFGLGYVHAQDRLWQMVFTRAAGEGRLAEMLGEPAVDADILLRTADLPGAARASLDALEPETRAALDAYAAGVNAYVEGHRGPLSPELALLGVRPRPWDAASSVLMLNMVSLQLSANAYTEIVRAKLGLRLAPGDVGRLLHDGLAEGPVALGASNNWVVDGRFTKSGKPLLANDPHLPMTAPSLWYLAHLSYPGTEAIGGTMAGIPAIIIGRNAHIAWGFTTTGTDVQDLYYERVDPADPARYASRDGWKAFATREEEIEVRFGASRHIVYRATENGPVVPPGLGFLDSATPEGHVLSLAWTALAQDNTTMDVATEALEAKSAADAMALFERYVVPMQNVVIADTQGHIGFVAPGRVPIRADAHPTQGLLPSFGWLPETAWTDFIPFSDLPCAYDPAKGYVLTANNRIVGPDYRYLLTYEWDMPYRAQRIEDLLTARRDHDIQSFAAMQADTVSLAARDTLALLLPLTEAADEESSRALGLLARWGGDMRAQDSEPLIFIAWMRALSRDLLGDELGADLGFVWRFDPVLLRAVYGGDPGAAKWCDDTRTPGIETCTSLLGASLAASLAELRATVGQDMRTWRWGKVHRLVNRHQPFGSVPVLGALFDIAVETGGDYFTIDRGGHSMTSRRPYENVHSAGYRGLYDLADPDASRFIVSTGQSGNPYSRHYRDLAPLWARGETIPMTTDAAAIAKTAEAVLRLVPDPQPSRSNVPRK
ncbi:MAG: penicillin acylase family protein [Alphaproteobacteria bacterium]|nr:penicillin acylase family protein [Alphaproteobacteria bacterium]